jgi:hypothetical protein
MGQYYKPCILQEDAKTIKAWVYSHDYGNGLKLMEHSYIKNEFVGAIERQLTPHGSWYKSKIVGAGDYADNDEGDVNLYDKADDSSKFVPPAGVVDKSYKYIINHSKKLFVNKTKIKSIPDWKGAKSHPLPLLTGEGNGRGGGDFRGEHDLIGSWARDVISVEAVKPLNYKEVVFDLVEG